MQFAATCFLLYPLHAPYPYPKPRMFPNEKLRIRMEIAATIYFKVLYTCFVTPEPQSTPVYDYV